MVEAREARVSAWIDAVVDRHTRELSRSEFLKAIRALSARYVETRASLTDRSPVDTAGKRAAFAGFYAPLHFLTTQAVVDAVSASAPPVDRLIDLGCGTGVASAAWALASPDRPSVTGVDRIAWSLDEARWNWRQLGLIGRTRRSDLATGITELGRVRVPGTDRLGVVLAWTVNELDEAARARLLAHLISGLEHGSRVLILEPLARRATPWWPAWEDAFARFTCRSDAWKFDMALPSVLAAIDHEAGFRRETIGARTLWAVGTGGANRSADGC